MKDEFYWGRRGPSVHLSYLQADKVEQVEWFYSEITVPEGQDGAFFLKNCGFFNERMEIDTEMERLPAGERPEVDMEGLAGY